MLTTTVDRGDGLALTCYSDGSGDRDVVLVAPPGMSVRHWTAVISRLRPHYRLLAFDYRGFPARDVALTAEQATFDACLDDLRAVLQARGIRNADFVSWCAGTWLVKALDESEPGVVDSLVAIGVGRGREYVPGEFEATIIEVQKMVTHAPASVPRIVQRMKKLGLIRDESYFQAVYADGDESELAGSTGPGDLGAMLGPDIQSSGLGFTLFDDATRFHNYLLLFQQFQDNFRQLDDFAKPLSFIAGVREKGAGDSTILAPAPTRSLRESTWLLALRQASEFILLERARSIADEIVSHLEQRCPRRRYDARRPAWAAEVADGT